MALILGVLLGISVGAMTVKRIEEERAAAQIEAEQAAAVPAEDTGEEEILPDIAENGEVRASSVDLVETVEDGYLNLMNLSFPRNDYNKASFVMQEDGRMTYEDEAFTSRCGIDVSEFNGEIDWEAVKAAGYDFAFLRLGYRGYDEGALQEDHRFRENLAGALAAGMDVGVYFFAQAINEEEAVEEADYVAEMLAGTELHLPVIYDPEPIKEDEARTDNVTGAQFTRNTVAFCERIETHGYEAGYYANLRWQVFMLDMAKLSAFTSWYAEYGASPRTPYGFSFWQYSNTGSVPGIPEDTDLNIQLIPKTQG